MFSCDLAALAASVSAPAAEGSLATLQQAKNVVFILLKYTWADIQRQGSILAYCLFMTQIQLQKSSYWSLPFCADLLIYEINYWGFKQF